MDFNNSYSIDPITSCWLWFQGRTTSGYGELLFLGKMRYAHRVSLHLSTGFDLDSPLCVLHKCDKPYCVNPDHLFVGSIADNNHDMHSKGRSRGRFSNKTHCIHGHELQGKNLYVRSDGSRACNECKRLRDLIYRPWRHKKELSLRY